MQQKTLTEQQKHDLHLRAVALGEIKGEMTGYPSKDKPWLKYYNKPINTHSYDKSLYQFIYDNRFNRINDVAMIYYNDTITYGKLFTKIDESASAFARAGIKYGDKVSILSLNTPETIYCIYGLNAIGAVINFLPAMITKAEIIESISKTESKMLVALDKILFNMGEIGTQIPIVELPSLTHPHKIQNDPITTCKKSPTHIKYNEMVIDSEERKFNKKFVKNSPAVILYTSGSTGTPKGVVLTNESINSGVIQCISSRKECIKGEKFLNLIPPFIAFGLSNIHLCLYTGMVEIICLATDVTSVGKMLFHYKPEHFPIGPAITELLEEYPMDDLSFITDLTGGGGSISLEKERLLNDILKRKKSKSPYCAAYGMTELSAGVSMNYNDCYKEQSIGLPLPLTNIKIIDINNGNELGYDTEGELLVNSPGMMIEYYQNQEETNKTIEIIDGERWLHTGDLAIIDKDGFVFITGRIKRIFTVKAADDLIYKIFPQRMEAEIDKIDFVSKCGVIVVEDEKQLHIPIVFVQISNYRDDALKISEYKKIINGWINQNLPSYYRASKIIIIPQMPITSSKKIDYRKLEQMLENRL